MEEKYFAASNSGEGFVSYFGEIFRPDAFEHVYIIKGGPGTGKSYFMRRIAEEAEVQGERVIYWYCSSDPDSLDGITIGKRLAFLDGTAPHDTACRTPGAAEDLIDLGVFWSVPSLAKMRQRIEALNAEKSRAYRRAYRFLSAYSQLSEAVDELVLPFADSGRIKALAVSLLSELPDGEGYSVSTALCDSVGMKGKVRFDTYGQIADRTVRIFDCFETAHLLLAAVASEAKARRMRIKVSYDPIMPKRINAVLVEGKLAFCATEGDGEIKMRELLFDLPEDVDDVAKRTLSLRTVMLSEAVDALGKVRSVHFEIEEIYKNAMDFKAKEEFTERFIRQIVKKQ